MDAALPVVVDLRHVLRRLAVEEDDRRRELVRLEARLRQFEDVERPAYASWLRLELGPAVTRVEEVTAALRAQSFLADRVDELVAVHGLHPREALHAARTGGALDAERDAVAARRQAKLDRKRAERKQAKRARRAGAAPAAEPRGGGAGAGTARIVTLYRELARRLHPDSPTAIRGLAPARLRIVWGEVQVAYATRNLERLLALATWLATQADAGAGDPDAAAAAGAPILSLGERHGRLRALRGACRALERRLAELASDPAWGFLAAPAAVRRTLKEAAADRLAAELDEVARALREVEDFIAAIGSPRPPRARRR